MSVMSHTAPYSAARSGLGGGKAGSEPLVLYSLLLGRSTRGSSGTGAGDERVLEFLINFIFSWGGGHRKIT